MSESAAVKELEKGRSLIEQNKVLIGELDELAPKLGAALEAAFSGPLAPLQLLAIGIGLAKKALDDYNAELDKVTNAELAAHQRTVSDLQQSWDEAAVSLGKYYAAMATAGGEKDPIKKQLEDIQALNDAELDSARTITEALNAQEIARLRAGGADPAQIAAVTARQQGELDAWDRQKESAGGPGGLEAELKFRQTQEPDLKTAVSNAQKEATSSEMALKHSQDEQTDIGKQLQPDSELSKKLDALPADLDQAKGMRDRALAGGDNVYIQAKQNEVRDAQERLDDVLSEPQRLQKRAAQLPGIIQDRENRKDLADAKLTGAQEKSETNEARLMVLPGEIAQSRQLDQAGNFGVLGAQAVAAADRDAAVRTHDEALAALNDQQSLHAQLAKAVQESTGKNVALHQTILLAFQDLDQQMKRLQQQFNTVTSQMGNASTATHVSQ